MATGAFGGPCLLPSLLESLVTSPTATIGLVCHVVAFGDIPLFLRLVAVLAFLWRRARILPHMVACLTLYVRVSAVVERHRCLIVLECYGLVRGLHLSVSCYGGHHCKHEHNGQNTYEESLHLSHLLSFVTNLDVPTTSLILLFDIFIKHYLLRLSSETSEKKNKIPP